MLNLRNLMDFLPYYYREADTYKVSGKGILERYLEIFGNYFEDYIVADTKNILDILDIDNCPEIYLNYLWEFLGQMPFAYGCTIDPEKWSMYFNGFDSDEKMAELSKLWIIPKTSDNFRLSPDKVRIFLKYSVSLFKIRGTQRFFEILFKMYGLNCEIGYPQSDSFIDINGNYSSDYYGSDEDFAGSDCQSNDDNGDYAGREMYISRYIDTKADIDDNVLDECPLDKRSTCTKCITLPVTITGHSFDSEDIPEENFVQFQKICEAIFDRFLPYNVQAKIDYGFNIPCTYHISTYLKEGDQWIFLKSDTQENSENLAKLYLQDNLRRELLVKVLVSRTYRNLDDLQFRVGSITQVEPGETPVITLGEKYHVSTDIVHITRALENADYIFRSSEPNSDGTYTQINLPVTRNIIVKNYNLGYMVMEWVTPTGWVPKSDQSTEISAPNNLFLNILLIGNVQINNGPTIPVRIRDLDTGKIYYHSDGVDTPTDMVTIHKDGVYRYALVDFPLKQIEIHVTRVPERLSITGEVISRVISKIGETAKSIVHVMGDYDLSDNERYVTCIQARIAVDDGQGNITYQIIDDDLVNTYRVGNTSNKVFVHDYGHGSIALVDDIYSHHPSVNPIKDIRICCLKKVLRSTSQYLHIHTRNIVDGEEVNEYTNLWDRLTFRKGRITNEGTIVSEPDWVYSDWLDISEYQKGYTDETTPQPISRLEYHLIDSKFRYYEIMDPKIEYNNGEIFETTHPGKYIFKPVLDENSVIIDTVGYQKYEFNVESLVNKDVKYGISIKPTTLTYQPVTGSTYGKAINTVVTVLTSLNYAEGIQRDLPDYPLNFKFYVYAKSAWDNRNNVTPEPLDVVEPDDQGWSVDTQSSKYCKKISFKFTDENTPESPYTDHPAQDYVIVLDSENTLYGYNRFGIVTIEEYVNPNKEHPIIVPHITNDNGWYDKDWSKDNQNATWYPVAAQQTTGFMKVKVEGSDGSLQGYNTVNVYKLQNDTETLVESFNLNTYIDSINGNANGVYRLRVTDGTNISTSYVQITIAGTGVNIIISCSPSNISASVFPNGVNVVVTASTVNGTLPKSSCYVRRVDENNWYPSGHTFFIPCPSFSNNQQQIAYVFQAKGNLGSTTQFIYTP